MDEFFEDIFKKNFQFGKKDELKNKLKVVIGNIWTYKKRSVLGSGSFQNAVKRNLQQLPLYIGETTENKYSYYFKVCEFFSNLDNCGVFWYDKVDFKDFSNLDNIKLIRNIFTNYKKIL